jgi:hypothetical protein
MLTHCSESVMHRNVYANVRKFSEIINIPCDVVTNVSGTNEDVKSQTCVCRSDSYRPICLYCFTCKNIYLFTRQASASFGTEV